MRVDPSMVVRARIRPPVFSYEGRHQYRIYDPARHAVFVRRDVIFDEASIGPKTDNLGANPESAPESEVALGFPSFCFLISLG